MDLKSDEAYVWVITVIVLLIGLAAFFRFVKDLNLKKIVLVIAISVIIICCVFAYLKIKDAASKKKWPPVVSKCPDYWIETTVGDESICKNEKNLGSTNCPAEVNMDTFKYNSKLLAGDDCQKAKWARSCNLTWDGITNKSDIC